MINFGNQLKPCSEKHVLLVEWKDWNCWELLSWWGDNSVNCTNMSIDKVGSLRNCIFNLSEEKLLHLLLLFHLSKVVEDWVWNINSLGGAINDQVSVLIEWFWVQFLPGFGGLWDPSWDGTGDLLSSLTNLSSEVLDIIEESELLQLLLLVEVEAWHVHTGWELSVLHGRSSLVSNSPDLLWGIESGADVSSVLTVWFWVKLCPDTHGLWGNLVDDSADLSSSFGDLVKYITGITQSLLEIFPEVKLLHLLWGQNTGGLVHHSPCGFRSIKSTQDIVSICVMWIWV